MKKVLFISLLLCLITFLWFSHSPGLYLPVTVDNATTGSAIATQGRIPLTEEGWKNGLLGYDRLEKGGGLVLTPCRQIHMIGMKFPIDVVFMDRDYRVVGLLESIQPGETGPLVEKARLAVELPAGTIRDSGIKTGHVVAFGGPGALLIKLNLS